MVLPVTERNIVVDHHLNPIAIGPEGEPWTPEEAAELARPVREQFTCPHCERSLKLMVSKGNRPRNEGFPRWEHHPGDADRCRSIRYRKGKRETWLPRGAVWPAGKAVDPE